MTYSNLNVNEKAEYDDILQKLVEADKNDQSHIIYTPHIQTYAVQERVRGLLTDKGYLFHLQREGGVIFISFPFGSVPIPPRLSGTEINQHEEIKTKCANIHNELKPTSVLSDSILYTVPVWTPVRFYLEHEGYKFEKTQWSNTYGIKILSSR